MEALGNLRGYLPGGKNPLVLDLPAGSTVRDALEAAGVPGGAQWNASIGGRLVYAGTRLQDGEKVLVFAPIGGGDGREREGTVTQGEGRW